MKPHAIYLRKSRKDLEMESLGEMETLARHEKILTEYCERNKLKVARIYKELVSGDTIADRPMMQELLKDIYAGKYAGVVVMEVERLARGDAKDQGTVAEAFKYTNTLIITPTKTYDPNNEFDEEYFEFGLFMSRREYKTIKRRLMTARMSSVESGNFLGAIPPYGYKAKRIDKRTRILEVVEEEAKYVKLIFKWFAEDKLTVGEIARRLTAMGVPTRTGKSKEWNKATIYDIIKNDSYRGKIRWQHRRVVKEFEEGQIVKNTKRLNRDECILVDGSHEILIDDDLFFKAQEQFKGSIRVINNKKLSNIFAGLLRCKFCGKAMVYQKNKGRIVHPYNTECKNKSSFYDAIIDAVIEHLKAELSDYEDKLTDTDVDSQIREYEQLKSEYETEIMNLKKQRLNAFDRLDRGIYTEEEFVEYKEMINQRIEATEYMLSRLERPEKSAFEEKAYTLHKVIDSLKDERIEAREKNNLLKEIISNIDYARIGEEVTLEITYL